VRILVVNTGSSSVKVRVLEDDDGLSLSSDLPGPADALGPEDFAGVLAQAGPIDAVGHRVVHGGTRYDRAVLVDDAVMASLRSLEDLAPLHQRASLDTLETVRRLAPELPAVACFDTAFHAGMPPAASTYALPRRWQLRHPLRRYGFHGLSHAYASRRAAEILGLALARLRIVVCHLGAGASLAAVDGGRSVDTTMGFTPLEGLVMATRSGSVDPGLVLWLAQHGVTTEELVEGLEHGAGLLGLCGTGDMRTVLARAAGGDPDARLALDVYDHRLRGAVAAMAAAMGGIDGLVFTGGVGEHAAEVRRRAGEGLGFLGVRVDAEANEAAGPDAVVSPPGAAVPVVVVAAREDVEIARGVRRLLGHGP